MKTKFDSLVEATMMDYLKAGAKTAIKAPFKAAGYVAKKAIDPRTYLKGAGAIVGGAQKAIEAPGQIVKGLTQGLVYGPGYAGDPTQLTRSVTGGIQKGLGAAEKGITSALQGAKSSVETQVQKDQMKKLYGTTDIAKNVQTFDANYFINNPSIYKGIKSPDKLGKGDGFIVRSRYGGQLSQYKVLANKNGIITAIPAAINK